MDSVNYINVNKKRIQLIRNEDETNYGFNLRKNFIKRMAPKTKKEIEESIRLSYIFQNIKLLGCIYPKVLEDNIMLYNNRNNKKNNF